MLQQQLSEKSPQAVNKATHKAWAQEYGVICLSGSSTFYTIDGADQPQFWPPDSLRQALKPAGVLPLLMCLHLLLAPTHLSCILAHLSCQLSTVHLQKKIIFLTTLASA